MLLDGCPKLLVATLSVAGDVLCDVPRCVGVLLFVTDVPQALTKGCGDRLEADDTEDVDEWVLTCVFKPLL